MTNPQLSKFLQADAGQTTGIIIKVSGPLVIAKNMSAAKMYEVVKVSDKKLVGEVIELRGDTASIQVYEETSGIGPGEPVFLTGESLSVELGPGILENIYDGIQRPLPALKQLTGNFIARGVESPGLDRNKKWRFKPIAKQGDEIAAGDIIGTVQETEVIEHKIMAMPGISGKLEFIVKEGDYTVIDKIAEIRNPKSEIKKLTLMQKWPIRKPRPIKKKLLPKEPLITGQRIVDAFFPITKGGTGSVPGPFGSGKCISGDTLVMLANGEIHKIENIFNQYQTRGKNIKNQQEEYTILDKPLKVLSYVGEKIIENIATSVYKGKTSQLIEITTQSGKKLSITPVHKLLTTDGVLNIVEKEAHKLEKGDYLVAPRKLSIKNTIVNIDPLHYIPRARIVDAKIKKQLQAILTELAIKFGSLKLIAQKINIPYHNIINYKSRANHPPIWIAKKIFDLSHKKLHYSCIKTERKSTKVSLPKRVTKEFAEFLGLIYGDGMIKNNSVSFYNNDSRIQKHFRSLSKKLFSVTPKKTISNTVDTLLIHSSVITEFIKKLGYPEYKKSVTCGVPSCILQSNNNILSSFLGAYFACDGTFGGTTVEISTSSNTMASHLSYVCMRLGIENTLRKGKTKNFIRYRLYITNKESIKRFYTQCKIGDFVKFSRIKKHLNTKTKTYTAKDIVPMGINVLQSLYTNVGKPYKMLKNKGIEIHNYIGKNAEHMSKSMFQKFADVLKVPLLQKIAHNHLEHISYDKITNIRIINKDTDVYDLEVPYGHNFIGGNSPIFLHNTVIQQQLAKWADADIIVYVGCGERGNEMTEVLQEFPELIDPKSGKPLMKRTVLVANTSNMPVAAREASVYTGITIAEYYRDMGYKVALMADSTSRWAEAMREMSGRLEEMPGEEGYPAYLGSRTAAFYERAGMVKCLGQDGRQGSLTVVGAVSPPGGDLSEPVTQNTLRVTKVFWALDAQLAYRRHYPAINWLNSYSLYSKDVNDFMKEKTGADWPELRTQAMDLLQQEASLQEIVRLVGVESLSPKEQLILDTAKSIREDFLQQNAYDEVDTYTSVKKMYLMLKAILAFHDSALKKIADDPELKIETLTSHPLKEKIAKMKFVEEEKISEIESLAEEAEKV